MSDNAILVVAWAIATVVAFASAYLYFPSEETLQRMSERPNVAFSAKQP